ncbi:MAG: cytidylate kinase-like family protein [Lachnospiraceae bacterium]
MEKYYVTISRQFGSLGRSVAHELSQLLGIEYYDRDIVEETSRKMSLPVSAVSNYEEKSIRSNLFNMLFPLGTDSIEKQDRIFRTQQQIILNLADKNSCIFVGRCADYVLKDYKNCFNIFIYASEQARLTNCIDVLKMKAEDAKKMIREVDRARDLYWKRYASYSPDNYQHRHFMIDSSLLGVTGTAELLDSIIRKRFDGIVFAEKRSIAP